MLLFGVASVSLLWMHFTNRRQELASAPELERLPLSSGPGVPC